MCLAALLVMVAVPAHSVADPNAYHPGAPTCHFGSVPTATNGCPAAQPLATSAYVRVNAGDAIAWDNDGAIIGGSTITPDVTISVYDGNGLLLFTEDIGLGDSQTIFVAPPTPALTDKPLSVEWTDTLTGALYATWTMCYPEIQQAGPLWVGNCPLA